MTDGVGVGERDGVGVVEHPKKIDNPQKPVTLEDKLGQGSLTTLTKPEPLDITKEAYPSEEQLRKLSIDEYVHFLSTLSEASSDQPCSEAITAISKFFPVIVDRFQSDIQILTSQSSNRGKLAEEESNQASQIGLSTGKIIRNIATSIVFARQNTELMERYRNLIQSQNQLSEEEKERQIQETEKKLGETIKPFSIIQEHITPESLTKFFTFIESSNKAIRYYALEGLPNVLYTNHALTGTEDLFVDFTDYFHEELENPKHPEDQDIEKALTLAAEYVYHGDVRMGEHYADCIEDSGIEQAVRITRIFGEIAGLDPLLKGLRARAEHNKSLKEKFDHIQSVGFIPEAGQSHTKLDDLYRVVNYGEYPASHELNDFELNLLLEHLPRNSKWVEIACGTGRLLVPLLKKGIDIEGFDMMSEHITQALAAYPEAGSKIYVSNWDQYFAKTPSESVDAVVCLGRTPLHNETINDHIEFWGNVGRILTKKGIAITDIPDIKKSEHYIKERKRFSQAVGQIGGGLHEPGSIVDSPNGKDYFHRLAPTEKQFQAICIVNGLEAKKIETRTYSTENGASDTNIYWKITKKGDYSEYEIECAYDDLEDLDYIFWEDESDVV